MISKIEIKLHVNIMFIANWVLFFQSQFPWKRILSTVSFPVIFVMLHLWNGVGTNTNVVSMESIFPTLFGGGMYISRSQIYLFLAKSYHSICLNRSHLFKCMCLCDLTRVHCPKCKSVHAVKGKGETMFKMGGGPCEFIKFQLLKGQSFLRLR